MVNSQNVFDLVTGMRRDTRALRSNTLQQDPSVALHSNRSLFCAVGDCDHSCAALAPNLSGRGLGEDTNWNYLGSRNPKARHSIVPTDTFGNEAFENTWLSESGCLE